MKKLMLLNKIWIALFLLSAFTAGAQDKYYQLSGKDALKTSDSKALKKSGTCWSNAGTAFLEAEWLRLGKAPLDISVMHFVHTIYLKKADVFIDSDKTLHVDPVGTAFDVVMLSDEFGMIPEEAYMYPEASRMGSKIQEGEMDAKLRGTLQMVQRNGEGFSERWENIFNTTLLTYIGDSKLDFTYKGEKYSPQSFAAASGLSMADYILLSADPNAAKNKSVKLDLNENWAGYNAFNVPTAEMIEAVKASIQAGYTVLWYGALDNEFLFEDENMAIVPASGTMPGEKADNDGEVEEEFVPVPEASITDEMRTEALKENMQKEQDYLLIFGLASDQKGNEYFKAKKVCAEGNHVFNMSKAFVDLNTIYLMANKNGLPADLQKLLK